MSGLWRRTTLVGVVLALVFAATSGVAFAGKDGKGKGNGTVHPHAIPGGGSSIKLKAGYHDGDAGGGGGGGGGSSTGDGGTGGGSGGSGDGLPTTITTAPNGTQYSCKPRSAASTVNDCTKIGGGPTGPAVNPADLAINAVNQMYLTPINVGMAPKPIETNPKSVGVVTMPVWMWVDHPTANTFGPNTKSASAGPVTVTATATVTKIVWTMGDGHTVTCANSGTPYRPGFGNAMSHKCGYRYKTTSAGKPKQAYPVAAASYWTVNWHANTGQGGVINLPPMTQTVHVRVGEVQVLTQ